MNRPANSVSFADFVQSSDIGAVKIAGSMKFDPATHQYTLCGAGTNMWLKSDEFHFAYRRVTGDFILRARVSFVGHGVDPHRKIGCIVRSSLAPDSAYADAAVHGDGLTSLQFRRATAATTEELRSPITSPDMLELARTGDRISMKVARFGQPFADEQSLTLPLGGDVYVGLFITSHNPSVLEQATFTNVRLVVPASPKMIPYRDYLGSSLEILDVASSTSRVIYRTPDCIEAPNWTRDGRSLIYNSKGRLFRFDLESATPTLIDTGAALGNNNDHVLSFDGQWLGISSNHGPTKQSAVYVLPLTGGSPRLVTTNPGPSYLHGWSPDGKTLLFTGERGDGNYDIYSIPSAGGEETRLTTSPGLDDGSEYTPDGQFIYFNSVRSGRMQIWRMRPDGSRQEQVTDDAFNNWFPHISPDGKWIAFLSYGQDVAPGDHPYYKHVYLRLMPAAGGPARVIAYIYGGQGTINVPSWSPDSQHLAYVSHTGEIP